MKRRIPSFTLALVVLSALIQAIPGAPEALRFDIDAVAAGQNWRPFTASLSHFSSKHWVADAGGLFVIGSWFESIAPVQARSALIVTGLLTAGILLFASPAVAVFGGLSGLGMAMLVGLGAELFSRGCHRPGILLLGIAGVQLAVALWRPTGASPVLPSRVQIANWVHALGAAVALGVHLVKQPGNRRDNLMPETNELLEPERSPP